MEELELIAQEKIVRERAFNEALLQVQSEKDAREKREVKNKRNLKTLTCLLIGLQRLLMRICVYLRSRKIRKPRSGIRSLLRKGPAGGATESGVGRERRGCTSFGTLSEVFG